MKTICLSLLLLLLSAWPMFSTAPEQCCVRFYKEKIPTRFISDIKKTHRSLTLNGPLKRQICYGQSFEWAVNVYNQRHTQEGSTQ
uniref:Chemokine interleukin-8-like domain-containing protein n=1 Tax=Salarias fasciatus TaxID=181472 RepID=A0A672JH54_SALFA